MRIMQITHRMRLYVLEQDLKLHHKLRFYHLSHKSYYRHLKKLKKRLLFLGTT